MVCSVPLRTSISFSWGSRSISRGRKGIKFEYQHIFHSKSRKSPRHSPFNPVLIPVFVAWKDKEYYYSLNPSPLPSHPWMENFSTAWLPSNPPGVIRGTFKVGCAAGRLGLWLEETNQQVMMQRPFLNHRPPGYLVIEIKRSINLSTPCSGLYGEALPEKDAILCACNIQKGTGYEHLLF